MSDKSPIFPISESQFRYFQVMEEARKHRRETSSRPMDTKSFKLQKSIGKDDLIKKIKMNKKCYLRNALLCLKVPKKASPSGAAGSRRNRCNGSISSLVYSTESPRAASMRPGMGFPYVSLRELNMERDCRVSSPIYLVT